jgi:hypothetical protein
MLVKRVEPVSGQADTADPLEYQGKRLIPEVASALNRNEQPYVYFVVYPDKAAREKPKIEVQFSVNGSVLAKQTAELPDPDASGAIPMMVGAATRPGNCELKITAMQGAESSEQKLVYSVAN